MPNFFRHFVPKITSKLHNSSKSGSLNKIASIVPSTRRKSVPQRHDRYDPTLRHSEYLELGENNNTWHSPAKVTEAGVWPIPANAAWNDANVSKRGGDLESGIMKTVKVEQYSRFPIT